MKRMTYVDLPLLTPGQKKTVDAVVDALLAKDEEAMKENLGDSPFPPQMLIAIRDSVGADFIREEGFDTIYADLLFGPGWLDEEEDRRAVVK